MASSFTCCPTLSLEVVKAGRELQMVPAMQEAKQAYQRHADELAALLRAVLESPGAADTRLRQAAYRGDSLQPALGEYVVRLRDESHRISDDDIQGLLKAGFSQDAVFELTVAAALGAAGQSLEAGLRAIQEEH
jgi:hypothetical protein